MESDLKHRLGGLFMLAIAGAVGWWGMWRPLQQAQAGVPELHYSLKALFIVPLAGVFGVFFLLVGDSVQYRDAERQRLTAVGWALFAVSVAIGAASWWWLDHRFTALGYGDTH